MYNRHYRGIISAAITLLAAVTSASAQTVVISQVFGGGGGLAPTFKNDYIELFNPTGTAVDLSTWSVQYASTAGSSWSKTNLSGSIAPGGYFLIQQGGGANGATLPTPDVTGTISMSATAGKVALVSNQTTLTGSCPTGVVDFVGYGTGTTCAEGSGPTASLSATTAALRANGGCTDTNDNAADFTADVPNPRNSASSANTCGGGPSPLSGFGSSNPGSGCVGAALTLTVVVTPGTSPTSTGILVTVDLSNIGQTSAAVFLDDGVSPDANSNDNVFTYATTIGSVSPGAKLLPVVITDNELRMATPNINVNVTTCVGAGNIVISQLYGGGGNSGSFYNSDFIELKNKTNAAISLSGWSVQYASATGNSWQVTPLSGSIPANGYFLVKEASTNTGASLPTPDVNGSIAMSATQGKVALVQVATALTGTCPTSSDIIDLVGFGAANCSEGNSPAPELSNTLAAVRGDSGCTDTNTNGADISAATPNPRNSASTPYVCGSVIPPSGSGIATPDSQCRGQDVTLTVTVTPGQSPTSTGITVTADMVAVGAGTATPLLDDGVPPDATADDNIFTGTGHVKNTAILGLRNIPVVISDAESRTGNTTIALTVLNCALRGFAETDPPGVCNGSPMLVTVTVTPGQAPPSTGIAVTADLFDIGIATAVTLNDAGTNGDVTPGDNIFSKQIVVPNGAPTGGTHFLFATITDNEARQADLVFSAANADCMDSSSTVVISEVYGGGGNAGADYKNDFIELYNRGDTAVDLSTWSVQYASAAGTSWTRTLLSGSIAAHGYYLVQESAGTGGTLDLPTPDAIGSISMSATNGKIALVSDATLLTGSCPSGSPIVDFVGFGTANCAEGVGAAVGMSNTLAVQRHNAGCMDTDNNIIDLAKIAPSPRNTASLLHFCSIVPCPTILGNMNHPADSVVDGDDVAGFVQCLMGTPTVICPCGDFNNNGQVDPNDVPLFVAELLN